MQAWLADGLDPDLIVPETLLLLPPAEGLVRGAASIIAAWRRRSAPSRSSPHWSRSAMRRSRSVDEAAFEAGLAAALADRSSICARAPSPSGGSGVVDAGSARRVALLAAALLLVLAHPASSRRSCAIRSMPTGWSRRPRALGPGAGAGRPNFDLLAPILFEAVRSTPNLQLTRLEYRPDGSLGATVQVDSPATLAAFRARAEASGAVHGKRRAPIPGAASRAPRSC